MPDEDFDEIPEPNQPEERVFRMDINGEVVNFGWNDIPRPNRIRAERQQPNPVLERARNNLNEVLVGIRNQRRGNGVNGQVLDTIGIELESIALTRDNVANILHTLPGGLGENFKVHRDGSSEIIGYSVKVGANGRKFLSLNSHTKEAQELFARTSRGNTYGYELISVPMDIETAELSVHSLLPLLEYSGDFLSERCATHIHVGGMKNLSFLKNALKLGLWFDEVFYAISGMGGRFRGYSNNANYARPLQNGPYFRYEGDYYQVLNYEKALSARNLYDFFACYGADVNREMIKYHPGRYFSINLYSIPRIGTIEFRHFNQTFNPSLLTAVMKLCQLFTELAIKSREREIRQLDVGNVFELQSPSYYLEKLGKLLNMGTNNDCNYNLSYKDIGELEKVIYNYQGIGVEDSAVLTHCKDVNYSGEVIQDGGLIRAKTKPISPGQVDIHNIKYSSILKG